MTDIRLRRPLLALLAGVVLLSSPLPAAAQDIRGLEVCTAEKQMDRRTGCLQANVQFLQQAIVKLGRDSDAKLAAAGRELAAAKADIAALKESLARLERELAQMKPKAPEKK